MAIKTKFFSMFLILCMLFIQVIVPINTTSHSPFISSHAATLPQIQSDGLALFLDWGYHYSESPKNLASRLRQGGTTSVYLSGWYKNQDFSNFCKSFIEAAHSNGVLVYLWLEFPMVSEEFWNKYPEYREKTALGKDAQLDWRLLMALDNPKCFDLAMAEVKKLYSTHPWDGINFAELYYESPVGIQEPSQLTPFNETIASIYATKFNKNITEFFSSDGSLTTDTTNEDLAQFMTFRQSQLIELTKKSMFALKPILSINNGDLIITQIDNYLDAEVARNIGIAPNFYHEIDKIYPYQLLIEDPFTLWHLDAERYIKIGNFYKKMNLSQSIGVDINIVNRLHNDKVLPKQAGEELMTLIRQASTVFSFVALYSADSITQTDLNNIPFTLAKSSTIKAINSTQYKVHATTKIRIKLNTSQKQYFVNNKPWGAYHDNDILLPPGDYTIDLKNPPKEFKSSDFHFTELPTSATQVLKSVYGITVHYHSPGKTFLKVSRLPTRVTLDGKVYTGNFFKDLDKSGYWFQLPQGKHIISFYHL